MPSSCPHCGWKSSSPLPTCPNCGMALGPEEASGMIRAYINDVWKIISKPHAFFRSMPVQGGLTQPLVFALVTHWIGAAFAYLWQSLTGATLLAFMEQFRQQLEMNLGEDASAWTEFQQGAMQWFWGVGSVIADPFLTLLSIFFSAVMIFLAARILVPSEGTQPKREVSFESAARVVCYGMTPSILAILPLGGSFVAWAMTLYVTVVGIKEVYQVKTGRALVIVSAPGLVVLGLLFAFLLFALVGLFAVFSAFL